MVRLTQSVVIMASIQACSPADGDRGLIVRPSDITSSTLEIGGVSVVSGSLDAYWLSVLPAKSESCEESRWLAIHTDAYGKEDGEVRPRVELAVPVEFDSGAPAMMPTVPVESPLVYPGFEMIDALTGAYSAFSGGYASWSDPGTGTLTFSLTDSDLCEYDFGKHAFTVCTKTEGTLTMVGSVLQTNTCYEGVAGTQQSPDGAPLCVFGVPDRLSADPIDCGAGESTAP